MDFAEYHPGFLKIYKIQGGDFKVQGGILQNPGGDFAKFYIFAEKLSILVNTKSWSTWKKFIAN